MRLSSEEKKENLRFTIVLNKCLPRVKVLHKRYFIDDKHLDTEHIHLLLKKAGHKIEERNIPCNQLPKEYGGIKINCFNYGMMAAPVFSKDYLTLKNLLYHNGYFSHLCGENQVKGGVKNG